MVETKFYVDLAPHPLGKFGREILTQGVFEYIKPYPKAEILFIESPPVAGYDFYEFKTYVEIMKSKYKVFGGDKEKLMSVLDNRPHLVDASIGTGASSILYEGEFYTPEEAYQLKANHYNVDNNFQQASKWLTRGSFDESFKCYKNGIIALTEISAKRESIFAPRLVNHVKENKIESVYIRFGLEHRGLLRLLPNVISRKFEAFPTFLTLNTTVLSNDMLYREFMNSLVSTTLKGSLDDISMRALDFIRIFDDNHLQDCGRRIEENLKKIKTFPIKDKNMEGTIIKSFLNELKKLHKEIDSSSAYWRIDLKDLIPWEWGGREGLENK